MIIIGYVIFLFIGVILGMIGGGGSILTIPVLVYLFQMDPIVASLYSLIIVGVTSLFGAFAKARKKLVVMGTAILFVIPSMITIAFTRAVLLPLFPERIPVNDEFYIIRSNLLLGLFSFLMIVIALKMILPEKDKASDLNKKVKSRQILVLGCVTGVLTGLMGAGGGFIIVPGLIYFGGMEMKKAIGTSLLIISMNALFGFVADIWFTDTHINWILLSGMLGATMVGVYIGNWGSDKMGQKTLKMSFGWLVLILGCYILIREVVFPFV